jgi:adenylate kinase family enzyme
MNYLITGVAGSGKSTIAKELRKRGYAAYDTEVGFSYFVNKKTGQRVHRPANPTLEWYEKHERVFDEKVLKNLLIKHANEPLFICSITANQKKFYPIFKKIFLLTIDKDTLVGRISSRTDNYFGKHPVEFSRLLARHDQFDEELKNIGAIPVDARLPLEKVTNSILAQLR